jgi:hypothetical protein
VKRESFATLPHFYELQHILCGALFIPFLERFHFLEELVFIDNEVPDWGFTGYRGYDLDFFP